MAAEPAAAGAGAASAGGASLGSLLQHTAAGLVNSDFQKDASGTGQSMPDFMAQLLPQQSGQAQAQMNLPSFNPIMNAQSTVASVPSQWTNPYLQFLIGGHK